MRSVAYLTAGGLIAAALAWFIELGTGTEHLADDSAIVLGLGLVALALIAGFGLVFTGGRWARRLGVVVAAAAIGLGAVTGPGLWATVGVVLAAAALLGLLGPWLKGWVRERPAADGPGAKPTVMVLCCVALIPAVGLASPAGLDIYHGVLAGTGGVLAWLYVRGQVWALWGLRIALVPIAVPAVASSPPAGSAVLAVLVAIITWLAWSKEARLAVAPLVERPPAPRMLSPKDDG